MCLKTRGRILRQEGGIHCQTQMNVLVLCVCYRGSLTIHSTKKCFRVWRCLLRNLFWKKRTFLSILRVWRKIWRPKVETAGRKRWNEMIITSYLNVTFLRKQFNMCWWEKCSFSWHKNVRPTPSISIEVLFYFSRNCYFMPPFIEENIIIVVVTTARNVKSSHILYGL